MGASKPSTAETDRILGGLLASQSSLVGKVQARERLSQRKWMMVFLLMTHLTKFILLPAHDCTCVPVHTQLQIPKVT